MVDGEGSRTGTRSNVAARRVSLSRVLLVSIALLLAIGSGCSKKAPAQPAAGPGGLTRLDPQKPKGAWLIQVQKKIHEVWLENAPRGLPGRVIAGLTVRSDGKLLNIRILESSGVVALDEYAVEAIQTAAPFPPFPPSMKSDVESFRTRFDYGAKAEN